MNALVIYDSVFGNTKEIALAISEPLSAELNVKTLYVKEITPEHLGWAQLLVIGAPTRAFSPSEDMKKALKGLSKQNVTGLKIAVFDTRIDEQDVDSSKLRFLMRRFGYAAETIEKKLVKKGAIVVLPAKGFYVQDSEGPLKDGEPQRAKEWACEIMTKIGISSK
jgi:flavodoxin